MLLVVKKDFTQRGANLKTSGFREKVKKRKWIDVGNPRGGRGLVLESPWGSGVDFGIPVGVEGVLKNPGYMLNHRLLTLMRYL